VSLVTGFHFQFLAFAGVLQRATTVIVTYHLSKKTMRLQARAFASPPAGDDAGRARYLPVKDTGKGTNFLFRQHKLKESTYYLSSSCLLVRLLFRSLASDSAASLLPLARTLKQQPPLFSAESRLGLCACLIPSFGQIHNSYQGIVRHFIHRLIAHCIVFGRAM